jgi:hypothetical protein
MSDKEEVFEPSALKECKELKEKRVFGKKVIYNDTLILWVYVIISCLIGLGFGITQEIFVTEWDVLYAVDLWSVSHVCAGVAIFVFIFIFMEDNAKTFIITFIVMTTYEPLEWYIGHVGVAGGFTIEIIWNQLADIIFNTMGMFIGYYLCKSNNCKK